MPRHSARYRFAVVFAFAFGLIAASVASGLCLPFDLAVRGGVHALSSRDLTGLAQRLTFIGSNPVWIGAASCIVVLQWLAGWRRHALVLSATMAGAAVLENLLKLGFHRARPEAFFGIDPETYSFPSGHALFATCFYGALALIFAARLPRGLARAAPWAGALLMVLGIGLSRVYLGVHYPSDVLAGYAAGAAWLSGLWGTGAFDFRVIGGPRLR